MQHPQDIARITDPPAKLMVRFVGDSARRTLIQYRATPDSLFGKIEGSAEGGHPLVQVAVAYDTVESIWAKRSGSGTHAMTLSAFPVLIGAMAYWILGVP
jgi:hypothetical protein